MDGMKKNDVILIGCLTIITVVVILLLYLTKTEGSKVLITVDGKEYATLELNKDTTYTVELSNGEQNTFVIKDGTVDMTQASCPDKLCVNHSSIHYNHETIVCLPNKVVLQIIDGQDNGVDAIAK